MFGDKEMIHTQETLNHDARIYLVGDRVSIKFKHGEPRSTLSGIVKTTFKFYGVNNDNCAVVWIMEPLAQWPSVLNWQEVREILLKEDIDMRENGVRVMEKEE